MIPRDRAGQDSIARAAPAGHSAPMPMPSRARNRKRKPKVGENPAMKLQSEYQAIESISGVLRPTRSASQPDAHAPTRRIQSVMVKTVATSVRETPNSLEIGTMISRNTVKSNASSVQPSQAAHHCHPLILGRLLPPGKTSRGRNGRRHGHPSMRVGQREHVTGNRRGGAASDTPLGAEAA